LLHSWRIWSLLKLPTRRNSPIPWELMVWTERTSNHEFPFANKEYVLHSSNLGCHTWYFSHKMWPQRYLWLTFI
jgi:hypothetical protein